MMNVRWYIVLAAAGALAGLAAPPNAGAATPSGFSIVASPQIAGGELDSVSASGPSDAWAVGRVGAQGVANRALVEHWNGMNWSRVPVPHGGDNVWLSGVDAVSAKLAWAVGTDGTNAITYRWNGKVWSQVPGVGDGCCNGLSSVSALPDGKAWAAGDANDGGGWLSEHWDGASWIQDDAVAIPVPDADPAWLSGVVAISPTDVWEVGGGGFSGGEQFSQGYTDHYDGSSWDSEQLPGPRGAPGGISAISSTSLWAVGTWSRTVDDWETGPRQPAIWRYRDGKWTFKRWFSHYTTDHELGSVAASSPSSAWAVGTRRTDANAWRTLITHRNGSSWTDLGGPNAAAGSSGLAGVAIVPGTTNEAWAVGSGGGKPLILQHP